MRFITLKSIAAIFMALSLTACQISSVGSLTYQGQPVKAEISQIENGLVVTGYDVYLNNEFIGRTQPQAGADNPVFAARASVPMDPIPSRFGTVKLVRNFSYGSVTFDVLIDDAYTGTIQMPQI